MTEIIPHVKNVPGDFYVEDGCCTACDLPRSVAPEHFKYDEEEEYSSCYVCKQPETKEELAKVLEALEMQELDCIHYSGQDKNILKDMQARKITCNSDFLQSQRSTSSNGVFNFFRKWLNS